MYGTCFGGQLKQDYNFGFCNAHQISILWLFFMKTKPTLENITLRYIDVNGLNISTGEKGGNAKINGTTYRWRR